MADLLPVIVGGLIGLAGGFIGPWLLQKNKDETERKKQRRDKFEELVTALFDYEHWANVARDMYIYGAVTEIVPTLPPSPLQNYTQSLPFTFQSSKRKFRS